jgi:hypothetical protein
MHADVPQRPNCFTQDMVIVSSLCRSECSPRWIAGGAYQWELYS